MHSETCKYLHKNIIQVIACWCIQPFKSYPLGTKPIFQQLESPDIEFDPFLFILRCRLLAAGANNKFYTFKQQCISYKYKLYI